MVEEVGGIEGGLGWDSDMIGVGGRGDDEGTDEKRRQRRTIMKR